MEIKSLTVSNHYKYLWLKKVVDVNLSEHCAKSLIGPYDERISSKTTFLLDAPLEDGVYYLCGVAYPYVWENNFHLAFMTSEGDTIEYSFNGISITISDAKMLPISESSINKMHPKSKFKSYNTCRNWQFAHWFNGNLK